MLLRLLARGITIASLGLAACGSKAAPSATTPATPATDPAPSGDAIAIEAGRFTTERVYMGECMPEGTRGGCYRLTFRPDGTYQHILLDAAMEGTYTIEGDTVRLNATEPAMNQQLTLSPDRTKLGDYTLEP